MSLPDSVAVKLNTYTLFCCQLLDHLQPLKDAVRTDQRLTCNQCCGYLDEELEHFFQKADPDDLQAATEQLGQALLAHVGYLRDRSPEVAEVFHEVVDSARADSSVWRYEDDLEALHQQGRQMARCFYEESPWSVTQDRLDREAQLVFLYEEGPELAFRESRNAILVRFNFDCCFGRYLAYPYLFMHEYVAHIFALDYGNERFNDGWLLHAADAFVTRRGWELELDSPLVREQITAFGEHLYTPLNPIPRRACSFARDFTGWLGDPERLQAMTWELAAFEPHEGESNFWPNKFINRLEQAFEHDRQSLRDRIESTSNLRALFESLPPV